MDSIVFLILLVLFIMFVLKLPGMVDSRSGTESARRDRRKRSLRQPMIAPAAAQAMRRARYEADSAYVQVTDIGLLAYRQIEEPKLLRYQNVMLDTRFLRPFAEIWLPYDAGGTLRFELVDHQGRRRYADESRYDLRQGKNTLLPGTWLPLEGKIIEPDTWTLRLLADETLLAVHTFGWQEVGGGQIQRFVKTDGEISPELQAALRARRSEGMSLSELLSGQED